MTDGVANRSRERVQEAIDRLAAEFGPFEPVDRHWEVTDREYETLVDRVRRGTLGGAGAWVTDDDGRVLLVRRVASPDAWSEPSGHHEPGEDLPATARREVREETGVDCTLTGVALFQHVRNHPPDGPPIHRAIVVFAADHVAGDPRPEPGEIAEARWWDRHPESLLYESLRELPIPAAE